MKIYFGFVKYYDYKHIKYRITSNSKTIESKWVVCGGHFKHHFDFKFPMRLYKLIDWNV